MTDFREHRANGAVATARYRHVGALLEPSGWPIYPDSMCRFQEQSTRVGVMSLDTLGGR